ncbi:hypothetical protein RF11_15106 [Thelohanellus kitauei]|uniref:Uncharacterized protein n=1 Tax=Thelohanellus kitauei TaxID=669202 RepID=A0A0C2NAS9_THEKT|nr:hypothetical protein RF11_15106 [Thelohanellus kitauei]
MDKLDNDSKINTDQSSEDTITEREETYSETTVLETSSCSRSNGMEFNDTDIKVRSKAQDMTNPDLASESKFDEQNLRDKSGKMIAETQELYIFHSLNHQTSMPREA